GLVFVLTVSAPAKSLTLYVATTGNDRWSGGLDRPARDGADGPLASLAAALQAARAARRDPRGAPDHVTLLLRGGTYAVAETIVLRPEDSGPDVQHPFTIAAFPDERPVLSGGRRITGWKRIEADLWQASVPGVREGRWYFRQLFVNGSRRQRARSPNKGYFEADGEYLSLNPVKFKFRSGDIKKEWVGGDVEL